MKRNRTTLKKTAIGLVFILLVMGAVTLARYTSSVQGQGTATTALYQNNATFTLTGDDIPTHPNDSRTIEFIVSNTKENKTAEVAQIYEFMIQTAENIPFKFELSKDNGSTWKEAKANVKTDYKDNILNLNEQTDTWKLKITWPDSASESTYTNEIDYVQIKVLMEQKTS
ncbi:MAG: hypothetical protein ACLUQK_02715 [Clostridium sp.]